MANKISTIAGKKKSKPAKKRLLETYAPITKANVQKVIHRHETKYPARGGGVPQKMSLQEKTIPVKLSDRVLKKRGFHRQEQTDGINYRVKTRILMRLNSIRGEIEAATGKKFLSVTYNLKGEAIVEHSATTTGFTRIKFNNKEIV